MKIEWRDDVSAFYPLRPELDRMASRREELCLNCDIPMLPGSSGKMRCGQCGAFKTCCDNP